MKSNLPQPGSSDGRGKRVAIGETQAFLVWIAGAD
jgi:hypothetical protein